MVEMPTLPSMTDLEQETRQHDTRPDEASFRFIGKPVVRKEDERLTTGRGRFSDDFSLDGQAYAVMVRSPHPHARILGVDANERQGDAGRARRVHRRGLPRRRPCAPFRTIRCPRPSTT